MPTVRSALLVVAVAVAVTACSNEAPGPAVEVAGEAAPAVADAPVDEEPTVAPCRREGLERGSAVDLRGQDVAALSVELAQRTHRCAEVVVVAPVDAGLAALLAVPVALAHDAPLLLARRGQLGALDPVLEQLGPAGIVAVGLDPAPLAEGHEVTALVADATSTLPADVTLALAVVDHLDAQHLVAVGADDPETAGAAMSRLPAGAALVPVPAAAHLLAPFAEALPPTAVLEVTAADAAVAQTLSDRLLTVGLDAQTSQLQPAHSAPWPEGTATSWLVDPSSPDVVAVALAAATPRDEVVLPVDGTDLRAGRSDTVRLKAAAPQRVVLLGDLTDDLDWQLPLVLHGPELPGGGFRLFEDQRVVALYGHPGVPELGALGEQDLDASVERLRQLADDHDGDGRSVLPAFEIIATLATRDPGPDGDHSRVAAVEDLRPWVERAEQEGFYVVLDLQPGRSDFLTQARAFEPLLVEPHVGLALDAEWRLAAGQRPREGGGSVSAAEVQQVADWLAALTREHRLPQKLLLLHQSSPEMLPDRDDIVVPPELAGLVHVDARGPEEVERYGELTEDAPAHWWWGWRSRVDADDAHDRGDVLRLDPFPVYVSHQ